MMKRLFAIAMIIATAGCATMGGEGAVKSLGNDQYSISDMSVFGGSLPEHAARHCASLGKKMKVEGNTTQQGMASGNNYGVLIFSCYN